MISWEIELFSVIANEVKQSRLECHVPLRYVRGPSNDVLIVIKLFFLRYSFMVLIEIIKQFA